MKWNPRNIIWFFFFTFYFFLSFGDIYFNMNNTGKIDEELLERLKLLKAEDIIWTILIGLLILSFYANKIERDFLIHHNQKSRE